MDPNNSKSSVEPPNDDWEDLDEAELLSLTLQAEQLNGSPERCSVQQKSQPRSPLQKCEILKRKAGYCVQTRWSTDLSIPDVRPMDRFFKAHLSVSQLCSQSWCEIKMVYGLITPLVRWREMQAPKVTTGSSIHLARELEAHPNVVSVPVVTGEDKEAVLFLNTLQKITAIQAGQHVRELSVFGVVEGVFLTGIVDDLSRDDSGQLVLSDLKTRGQNSFPGSAQARGHALQVGLYKLLFDAMVTGRLERDWLVLHLQERHLQPERALSAGVRERAEALGYPGATLGGLLDLLLAVLASSNIQGADRICIEYTHQGSGGPIGTREVEFEEAQLRGELRGYLAYWSGEREPQGVDIEDAWKCRMCPYEEICDWRKAMSQKAQSENGYKRAKLDSPMLDRSRLSGSDLAVPVLVARETLRSPSRVEGPTVDPGLESPKLGADGLGGPKRSCSSEENLIEEVSREENQNLIEEVSREENQNLIGEVSREENQNPIGEVSREENPIGEVYRDENPIGQVYRDESLIEEVYREQNLIEEASSRPCVLL